MAIHSSMLAWEVPWGEEPGGLPGCKIIRHDGGTKQHTVPYVQNMWAGIPQKKWSSHHSQQKSPRCSIWIQSQK